jgi:O-antigen/teichoic acid export membrane protein
MTEAATLRSPSADATKKNAAARRGGILYFISAIVGQTSGLLRYVLLARLLGPEQVGIASTLVVTASFFDMISDVGAERFLVQDREGGAVEVQSLVQSVAVGRGVLIAVALLICAYPLAHLYRTPPLAAGLMVMAVVPVLYGLQHLDNRRVQRDHNFRPEAISSASGDILGLVATITAAVLTRNFTAIIYGIVVKALVTAVTSHMQARRPYRLGWSREHWPRLARFAVPLMLNGLMIYLAQQGDRVIVAQQLGVKTLGYYSAVMLLIYFPASLVAKTQFAINIPLVAGRRDEPAERNRTIDHIGAQTMLLTIAMSTGFAIVAPTVVPILYGRRFEQTALVVGLIGCLHATRVMMNWPATVALSTGRSTTVLASNIAHGFAFAGAFVGLALVGGLAGLVAGFTVGELMAVGVGMALVNGGIGRPLWSRFDLLAGCVLTYAMITATNLVLAHRLWWGVGGMLVLWLAWATWLFWREKAVILDALAMVRRSAGSVRARLKI